MKFTKEEAIKALEAKIPAKDKDLDLGRTISEAVDNSIELVGDDSEMELNDFVEKVWKQVKTSIGLTHNENSKIANNLKKQIDDLQKKLQGTPDPPKPPKPEEIKSDDPAIQAMLDKLTQLEDKLAKKEKEQTVEEKRKSLAAKMGESIKDKDWIDSYLAEITVTEDTDVEAKAKDYVAFYNKTHTRGGKTTPAAAGGDDQQDNDVKNALTAAKAIMEQRNATMGGSPVKTTNV